VSTAPQRFDWVKARADCSVLVVFNQLRLAVEEDIKIINVTPRPLEYQPSFGIRSNWAGDCFVVFQVENSSLRVEFNCQRDYFEVTTQDNKQFKVTLTLNNEGRCKLRVDGGEELEEWQLRRMMLEDLFFTSSQGVLKK